MVSYLTNYSFWQQGHILTTYKQFDMNLAFYYQSKPSDRMKSLWQHAKHFTNIANSLATYQTDTIIYTFFFCNIQLVLRYFPFNVASPWLEEKVGQWCGVASWTHWTHLWLEDNKWVFMWEDVLRVHLVSESARVEAPFTRVMEAIGNQHM